MNKIKDPPMRVATIKKIGAHNFIINCCKCVKKSCTMPHKHYLFSTKCDNDVLFSFNVSFVFEGFFLGTF